MGWGNGKTAQGLFKGLRRARAGKQNREPGHQGAEERVTKNHLKHEKDMAPIGIRVGVHVPEPQGGHGDNGEVQGAQGQIAGWASYCPPITVHIIKQRWATLARCPPTTCRIL